ncbi:head GIN domain-containing protein [Haloflavibacter putidus]|uniref:DUF2807 domain-containing protein n=1 Tax=Haloflavibacter putidus TaxID=2576776 RepID=A0A507ZTH4_9FLAO|nr:head GIN domain-containing protein [Haloflavibacter putidus]TQD40719.1 DUF2807 domain-containing protein [Haloflavibacter putidus]
MKNILGLLLLFSCTFAVNAQNVEFFIDKDFTEIKLYSKIEATLIKSDQNKVVAQNIAKEDLSVKVKDGTLRIKSGLSEIFEDDIIQIKIYYTGAKLLDVNEGSVIEVQDKIVQPELTLSAQEGAQIITQLEVEKLIIKVYSGGRILAKGTAKQQEVAVKAGGSYEAKKLESITTQVKVSAGGSADVFASKSCDAKVTAGGTIYIYGNPSTLKQKTTFGGTIISKN